MSTVSTLSHLRRNDETKVTSSTSMEHVGANRCCDGSSGKNGDGRMVRDYGCDLGGIGNDDVDGRAKEASGARASVAGFGNSKAVGSDAAARLQHGEGWRYTGRLPALNPWHQDLCCNVSRMVEAKAARRERRGRRLKGTELKHPATARLTNL